MRSDNPFGLKLPEILLPDESVDLAKWPVIACDQFTSEPEYWEGIERAVGAAPSALHCILPECYLGSADEDERIRNIHGSMKTYLEKGVLRPTPPGVILVERDTCFGRVRRGMIAALDLEKYDFRKGSASLIRPTEGTIVERLPPRIRVRKNAPIEFPHIIILIDDPGKTVIEPLFEKAKTRTPRYETGLIGDGGRVRGWFFAARDVENDLERSLSALADGKLFAERYDTDSVLLFAVGDGNHSLATAKAVWEELKGSLDAAGRERHPSRWALVEIENLYDPGIVFEPIHRILFGLSFEDFKTEVSKRAGVSFRDGGSPRKDGAPLAHAIPLHHGGKVSIMELSEPSSLESEALDRLLSGLLEALPRAKVDYIHGEGALRSLSSGEKTIGFELRPLEKGSLFPTVIRRGVLPKKTFSIGEASEKRYYLEGRMIRED